jgi:N-glycosylase/DNA lyase
MKIYNLKTCENCDERVLVQDFSKGSSVCKFCVRQRKAHKKRVKAAYRLSNRKLLAKKSSEWNRTNKDKYSNYQKQWAKENKGKVGALQAARRAKKLSATPSWLTKDQKQYIEDLYTFCKNLSGVVGKKYHVDHVVPLQNKSVCGLHVPWNLQVITEKNNLEKGNSFNDWG